MKFEEILPGVWRLKVPFMSVYTAVFYIGPEKGGVVCDLATTDGDVENIILPALKEKGLVPGKVFLSHGHSDHAGGLKRFSELCPEVGFVTGDRALAEAFPGRGKPLTDGEEIIEGWKAVAMPGHTAGHMGLWREKDKSLLTFDGVQLWGIGMYGTGLSAPGYEKTLKKLENLRPATLIASHEYFPLGSEARGEEAVKAYLEEALKDYRTIGLFITSNPGKSPEELAEAFREVHSRTTVGAGTFAILTEEIHGRA